MEKKGEILNQLAIIADLTEKINCDNKSTTIVIELSNIEFERVFNVIQQKSPVKKELPKDTFSITIGNLDVVFNTSNA